MFLIKAFVLWLYVNKPLEGKKKLSDHRFNHKCHIFCRVDGLNLKWHKNGTVTVRIDLTLVWRGHPLAEASERLKQHLVHLEKTPNQIELWESKRSIWIGKKAGCKACYKPKLLGSEINLIQSKQHKDVFIICHHKVAAPQTAWLLITYCHQIPAAPGKQLLLSIFMHLIQTATPLLDSFKSVYFTRS